jgi:hypothetical protein
MNSIKDLLYQIEDQMDYERDLEFCTEVINVNCDDILETLEGVDYNIAKQIKPDIQKILDANNSIYRVYESMVCCSDAKEFLDTLSLICETYLTDDQLLEIRQKYGIDLLGELN